MTGRIARKIRGLAADVGAVPYRPFDASPIAQFDADYHQGELDRLYSVHEVPRYAVLLGYLRALGPSPAILDVGCGEGILRARMTDLPFGSYVGYDPAPAAVEKARALEDERTRFVVAAEAPSELGPFDVAVCNEVLYVLPDPAALLDQLRTLLAPTGHLLTSVWRHPGDRALHRLVRERFRLVDDVLVRNLASPLHTFRVSWFRVG